MKYLTAAVAVVLLSAAPDGRTPYEKAVASAVLIRIQDGTGMGVYVGIDTILTAAHVVDGEPEILAERPDGRSVRCTLLASDKSRDLALLRADAGIPMRLAGESASPGDPLFVVSGGEDHPFGYSGGHARKVYRANVLFPDRDMSMTVVETSAAISPGDSGSMIVDAEGYLAGICSYIDPSREQSYMGIDVSEIRAFLRGE